MTLVYYYSGLTQWHKVSARVSAVSMINCIVYLMRLVYADITTTEQHARLNLLPLSQPTNNSMFVNGSLLYSDMTVPFRRTNRLHG